MAVFLSFRQITSVLLFCPSTNIRLNLLAQLCINNTVA